VSLHQLSTEPAVLDLKPSDEDRAGLTIDQVLEYARTHDTRRDGDDTSERRLPMLAPVKPWWNRLMWFVIAVAIAWGQFYFVRSFWAPAHPGVDQNGYQVGGKLFAKTFSTGFSPPNPFSYVGWMWVQSPNGWVYPKYPLGLPVLDAICIWLAKDLHQGVVWSYMVSPVCTVLASAAMFLMLRMVASGFAAVLGMLLMVCNPVALVLANNSNSHAAAMAFTCWGILFLLWWMRYGGWWRGLIAGLLLGCAVTIRYTEGLLVLPIAAAMLTSIRYEKLRAIRWWAMGLWIALAITGMILRSVTKPPIHGWPVWGTLAVVAILVSLVPSSVKAPTRAWGYVIELLRSLACAGIVFGLISIDLSGMKWKSIVDQGIVASLVLVFAFGLIPLIYSIRWHAPIMYFRPTVVLLGWLIPVLALVAFNKGAMGSWTGYDTTNESDGFSWNYFADKWDFMIGQVYNTGLFFVVPLAVAGMIVMYRASARVAAVMTLWFVPGLLLYTGYYWGQNSPGVGFLRFFLTLFPPMIFCAAWLLDDLSRRGTGRGSVATPLAAAIVVAIACSMNLYSAHGAMERDFTIQINLADDGDHILRHTKDTYEPDPKKRPLLFGEARQLLNYIQFAGNYECYANDTFTMQGGSRMWRGVDPDAPNPLQKARVDAMRKLYEGKSDNDLWREGNKIVDQALAEKRHVYVALTTPVVMKFRLRFSPKDYELTTLDKWREPVTMSEEARKALLGLGPAGAFLGGRGTPQSWELIEITKKAPGPAIFSKPLVKSTTRPASMPTTRPKALFEIK
jgi:hypothetical protein